MTDLVRHALFAQLSIVVYLVACAAIGLACLERIFAPGPDPFAGNGWLRAFFALVAGLATSTLVLFVLGVSGLFAPWAVLISHGALLLWATRVVSRASWMDFRAPLRALARPESWLAVALYAWIALAAIRPPGHFDDTLYHLPLARYYVEHHALAVQPFLRYPFFPQNMELQFALGLMFGGDIAAQALATTPLFVIGLGLIGAGRWLYGSILPGFAATVLLLCLKPVLGTIGYAYIDNGLALYCWGAYLALALWEAGDRREVRWLWLAGALAGTAVGCKLFGIVPMGLIGAWLLLVRREWRSTLAFSVPLLLFGTGWYLRSWVLAGDPIHPLGGPVFGYYLWDAHDLAGQLSDQAKHNVTKSPSAFWHALVVARMTIWGLALGWVAFAWKAPRPMKLLYGLFLANLLFWFFATQIPRYLAPNYALGCLLSASTLTGAIRLLSAWPMRRFGWRWRDGWWAATACLLVVGYLLNAGRIAAGEQLAHWRERLESRSGYPLYSRANQLAPRFGGRLTQIGFESGTYFYNGVVIGDWFGPARYYDWIDCKRKCRILPPEQVKAKMHSFGSRMLMVNIEKYRIDMNGYLQVFDLAARSRDGLLFTLKPEPERDRP
jgi:hypothetical protein